MTQQIASRAARKLAGAQLLLAGQRCQRARTISCCTRWPTPTGGRYNAALNAIFDSSGRTIPAALDLWPFLLAPAIALNLAELVMRKWRKLWEGLLGRRRSQREARATAATTG